jgi:hypothetical protein
LAVGVPLLGGIATGKVLAGVIAAVCALLVTLADIGTTRGSRVITMTAAGFAILGFCAVATAVGAGMQFTNPDIVWAALAGAAIAIGSAFLIWWLFGLPAQDNLIDWRSGLRQALGGVGAGPRYAICYATTACVALLAAESLGVSRPYWATIAVLIVMRREGTVSLQIILQYMIGTLAGIIVAALIVRLVPVLPVVAIIAVAGAASGRIGLAVNPALGYMGLTAFFMLAIDVGLQGQASHVHLLSTRLYDVAIGCVLALLGTLVAMRFAGPRKNAA